MLLSYFTTYSYGIFLGIKNLMKKEKVLLSLNEIIKRLTTQGCKP